MVGRMLTYSMAVCSSERPVEVRTEDRRDVRIDCLHALENVDDLCLLVTARTGVRSPATRSLEFFNRDERKPRHQRQSVRVDRAAGVAAVEECWQRVPRKPRGARRCDGRRREPCDDKRWDGAVHIGWRGACVPDSTKPELVAFAYAGDCATDPVAPRNPRTTPRARARTAVATPYTRVCDMDRIRAGTFVAGNLNTEH